MNHLAAYRPIHSSLRWSHKGIQSSGRSFGIAFQSNAISYSQLSVLDSSVPAHLHLYPEACFHLFFEFSNNDIEAWVQGSQLAKPLKEELSQIRDFQQRVACVESFILQEKIKIPAACCGVFKGISIFSTWKAKGDNKALQ